MPEMAEPTVGRQTHIGQTDKPPLDLSVHNFQGGKCVSLGTAENTLTPFKHRIHLKETNERTNGRETNRRKERDGVGERERA